MIEMSIEMKDILKAPKMRSVFKENSAMVGFTVVKILTTKFLNSFGFSSKPSEELIEAVTVDTLDKFSYESIYDIILFFKMARSGDLGTTSRGIDSNLIFGQWYPVYLEKKAEVGDEEYAKQKQERLDNRLSIDQVRKSYEKQQHSKKMADHMEGLRSKINEITKDFDRQMLEDLIITWEKGEKTKKYVKLLKEKRKTIK